MVLKPEPIFNGVNKIKSDKLIHDCPIILMSPQGKILNQEYGKKISKFKDIIVIAGRYEGFDQRILDMHADYKVSIGHTVISGGEVPAMYMLEALIRRIPGVLGNPDSLKYETFNDNKYDFPVYTRPETFNDLSVPEVLLSGNHAKIASWRKKQALQRTIEKRPDLIRNN